MTKHPGAAGLLMLALGVSAHADEVVLIEAPGGGADPSAAIECGDPPSPAVAADARGRASIPDGCRVARCTSDRWLGATAARGADGSLRCRLRPAVRLTLDLPRPARGRFTITAHRRGAADEAFKTISAANEGAVRAPVEVRPLPPGRYDFTVGRDDGSWTCRASLELAAPERKRVFIPWREPVALGGIVRSPEGRALSNIALATSIDAPPSPATAGRPSGGRIETWRCQPAAAPAARSAADGSFKVMVDPGLETLVAAGGWSDPAGLAFTTRRGTTATPMLLVPRAPHRARGRVLDEADRPVPCRARVVVASADETWAARALPGGPREAFCGADGGVDVGPFLAGDFEVRIVPGDGLPIRTTAIVSPETRIKDLGVLRVDRGGAIRVTVTDDDHIPLAGATIVATSRGGVVLERHGTTGAEGTATIGGLLADVPAELDVTAAGFARARRSAAPGSDTAIALARATSVTGDVAGPDGAPVVARVAATFPDGSPIDMTVSDDAGQFRFDTLPEGVALLSASAPGFAPSDTVRVTASGASVERVHLVVHDASRITGRVLDAAGAPLAGASVFLAGERALADPPETGAIALTRSAQDGTFALDSDGRPAPVVVATAPGRATAAAMARAPRGDPVDLVLGPEARLLVRFSRASSEGSPLLVLDTTGLFRVVTTAGRKEVALEGLAPGEASVRLGADDARRIVLVAGETATVDLSSGATVRGRVFREGRPCAQAAVAVVAAGSQEAGVEGGTVTGADGVFAIDGVPAGQAVLVASTGAARAEKKIDVPADGEIQVDLDAVDRTVRVLARDKASGRPLQGAVVNVEPNGAACAAFGEAASIEDGEGWQISYSSGGCARAVTGPDGSASASLAGAGPHQVSVDAKGFAAWSRAVDLGDGAVDLLVELERGGPPVVRVRIDSEPPLVSGSIYCIQSGHASSRSPVSGETTCDGLEHGPAEVAFRATDFGVARATVEVPESGEAEVSLRVTRGGELIVPVQPRRGLAVRIVDDRGTVWNLPSGLGWPRCGFESRDGVGAAYVCREIPPGAYSPEVDGRKRGSVVVPSGGSAVAW